MKKKRKRDHYMFVKKENETLAKIPGEIDGQMFMIDGLKNCQVYLYDHFDQVIIEECEDCTIHVGPCASSVFLRSSKNTKLYAAAKQIRISNSENIDAYVFAKSEPAIEKSQNIRFGPLLMKIPGLTGLFEKAEIDYTDNHWSEIYQFGYESDKQNQQWSILNPQDCVQAQVYDLSQANSEGDFGELENPVELPQAYGGTGSNDFRIGSREQSYHQAKIEGGDMMSFDIREGAQKAQEVFESQQQQLKQSQQYEKVNDGDLNMFFDGDNNQEEVSKVTQLQSNGQQGEYEYADLFEEDITEINEKVSQQSQPQSNNQGFDIYSQIQIDEPSQQGTDLNLKSLNFHREKTKTRIDTQEREENAQIKQIMDQASEFLRQQQEQREQRIMARKQQNREKQDNYQEEQSNKNSWARIIDNIELKETDYQGNLDVKRMKEVILAKRHDVQKDE